jgi:DNA-binding transcriptional ArsR family regulator
MRSDAPALMPIFRSQRQAELLALLFLSPDTELTLTELAARLGATAGAIHAEVDRLTQAGLLTDRFVGRSRLIRANTAARTARALSELLLLSFGPERVVAEEFTDVGSVEQVAIYGSWARRYRGETGPEPGDIDVMVIGHPDREAVYAAADRAAQRLSIPVNTTVRSPTAWAQANDALVITAKADALIVLGAESGGHQ